ncbi:hypothetical protein [uncultured Roseobacter sp.]|uniref:hypothetical protein n=1 Tax=uncultured Roseobacter sp. TaxID=114847 RepID=UPI00261C1ED5|nr:hypothetical protein [uncultured Roseobacter sp.]
MAAGCSGGAPEPTTGRLNISDANAFSSGPIQSACLVQRRPDATPERCGCIQHAANRTLSASQQQRGLQYFEEPHLLQEVRQSGTPRNERFWEAWKTFAETASALCRGV